MGDQYHNGISAHIRHVGHMLEFLADNQERHYPKCRHQHFQRNVEHAFANHANANKHCGGYRKRIFAFDMAHNVVVVHHIAKIEERQTLKRFAERGWQLKSVAQNET